MNEEYVLSYLKEYNHDALKNFVFEDNKINLLIRAYMNITMPYSLSAEFYKKQDEYLLDLLSKKTVIDIKDILKGKQVAIYKGDITLIKCDAIVNAANSKMLGCFVPLHYCIDNAIHSFGGLEIRRDLLEIMTKQNHDEPNGSCKVTKGYNLPARYVFHTCGPEVKQSVTDKDRSDLKNSYLSCLKMADKMHLSNIVFCSISTGVFGFPIKEASIIALETVSKYLKETKSKLNIVFDLFSDDDFNVYRFLFNKITL